MRAAVVQRHGTGLAPGCGTHVRPWFRPPASGCPGCAGAGTAAGGRGFACGDVEPAVMSGCADPLPRAGAPPRGGRVGEHAGLVGVEVTVTRTYSASDVTHGRHDMDQRTVRGFDDDLNTSVHRLAKREGISLNQSTRNLLRKGAGLTGTGNTDTVGSTLDYLTGSGASAKSNRGPAFRRGSGRIDSWLPAVMLQANCCRPLLLVLQGPISFQSHWHAFRPPPSRDRSEQEQRRDLGGHAHAPR